MTAMSEYQSLRKVLSESLIQLDVEMKKSNLPEFQITKPEFHPSDDPNFVPSQGLFTARRNAIASLKMLIAVIKEPAETAIEDSLSHWVEAAMQLASRTQTFDILIPAGPVGMSTKKLGEKIGMNHAKLGKLLRLLAAHFYLVEVKEDSFAVTRRGLLFACQSPIRSFVAWQSFFSFNHSTKCVDVWTDKSRTDSWKPIDTPASEAFDWKGKGCSEMWDWAAKYHPEDLQNFATAMASVSVSAVVEDYDWVNLPKDALIVDVGGGAGHVSISILNRFPDLPFQFIVQDRPEVRLQAENAFSNRVLPSLASQKRISFEEIDFFKSQPRRNANLYLLRFIIHDLDDDRAAIVLENIVKVMGHQSKVLIIDFILSPAVIAGSEGAGELSEEREVPFPLLHTSLSPEAVLRLDIEMSSAIAGTERTLKQSRNLYQRVGLKVNRIFHTRSMLSITELVLP